MLYWAASCWSSGTGEKLALSPKLLVADEAPPAVLPLLMDCLQLTLSESQTLMSVWLTFPPLEFDGPIVLSLFSLLIIIFGSVHPYKQ